MHPIYLYTLYFASRTTTSIIILYSPTHVTIIIISIDWLPPHCYVQITVCNTTHDDIFFCFAMLCLSLCTTGYPFIISTTAVAVVVLNTAVTVVAFRYRYELLILSNVIKSW